MVKAKRAARGRSLGVTQLAAAPKRGEGKPRLTLRVDFGAHGALGPGKIKLLELIKQHGSILAAGKSIDMSYRRAWLLVQSINAMFAEPAVKKRHGGAHGGNAELTKFGEQLVTDYRAMENAAESAASKQLRLLHDALAETPPPQPDAE